MEPVVIPKEDLDAYSCPVCKEVISKGVQIPPCNHQVCSECSTHISKNCPVCREAFESKDLIKIDKSKEIISIKTRCSCGLTLPIVDYSAHSEECWVVQEENEKSKANLLDKTKMKETVNRATFTCPVCKTANLERAALVDHVVSQHPHQKGVCPICVAQPWGDPNYVTTLSSHLKLRHKFDIDTYTVNEGGNFLTNFSKDYDKEDDAILRQVLEQSKSTSFGNANFPPPTYAAAENSNQNLVDAEEEMLRQILELSKNDK